MATPAPQSSPTTALPILVINGPSIRSYPPLFVASQNILIIGGDINARIGKNVNNKFSLHISSNRNEEHLTDFTLENRLTCLNTKFQGKKRENYGPTPTQTVLKHRNGIIAHWIARHTPRSRECLPITELSRQRYEWAYEGMQPEKPQPYTMTGPCLTARILEINIHSH